MPPLLDQVFWPQFCIVQVATEFSKRTFERGISNYCASKSFEPPLTGTWAGRTRSYDSSPGRRNYFCLPQTGSVVYPDVYPVGTGAVAGPRG